MLKKKIDNKVKKFSISDIENLTGIKAHTIRIWEQRYQCFGTKRTETNIRYYDDADLCRFLNVAILIENGYKISKISTLEIEEINDLVQKLKGDHYNLNIQVQMLFNAMLKMDDIEFDEILDGCIKDLGVETAVSDIVFPFLRKVGFMWQVAAINPAHEHFATHKIEQKLIELTYLCKKSNKYKGKKKYLLFLPPNENHEVGLLFAQYLLKSNGHQTLYLGQNLPYESLKEVNDYYEPDFAISILTVASRDEHIDVMIDKLKSCLGNTPLILAGNLIKSTSHLEDKNLVLIQNISEFTKIIGERGMSLAS